MRLLAVLFLVWLPLSGEVLSPRTLAEFDAYMRVADTEMQGAPKPWIDRYAKRRQAALEGKVETGHYKGDDPHKVTDGLIHDWVGSVFIPGGTLEKGLAVLRDYDRHAEYFGPEMMSSKLVSSAGGVDVTKVRLKKKKVITVVLDANFESSLRRISPASALIRIRSKGISEVEDAGEPEESLKPPDTGYGFLWRLHSWYLLEEKDGGLWVQLRSISLTRGIPFGLGGLIGPMVNSLPKESLVSTLEKARHAIQALR